MVRVLAWLALIGLIFFIGLYYLVARPQLAYTLKHHLPVSVDTSALEKHVKIVSEQFFPRNYQDIENLNATADYIQKHFSQSSAEVSVQKFVVEGKTYKNIIADFGPKEGSKIVVGAHYDTADETPGADDNASGVAGLLEIARLLAPLRLRAPVTLVAYTLEEPPYYDTEFMGSVVHAKNETADNAQIKLMIALEMIGYFSDEVGSQSFPITQLSWVYPSTGNFIAVVDSLWSASAARVKAIMNATSDLPAYSINAPKQLRGIDFSDHRSYWSEGFPGVMITDTAFYRNRAYHTENDIANRLDYSKMSQVVHGVLQTIVELAGME